MRLVPLPPTLSSSIPTIRWPLGPSSSPPLHFEPLEKLPKIRSKSPSRGSKRLRPIDGIADDVPTTINNLLSSSSSSSDDITIDQRHHLHVSLALLLLGHGYTDEAHDLVTPLSWPDDTHFGYGPVVYSTTSPSALSLATYTHSLVHRREGFNVGEFGMVGFSNANYWSNAALKSRGVDEIPFGDIRKAVLDVGKGNAAGERWCQERVIDEGGKDEEYWESRALHELCGRVMRMVGEEDGDSGGGGEGEMLRDFAERAAEVELRVLLRHALVKAGYEEVGDCLRIEKEEKKVEKGDGGGVNGPSPSFTSDSTETAPTADKLSAVDESVALNAANKVSSAHLNSFRTSGDVTLRNVLHVDPNSNRIKEGASMSASAGIAARILGSAACRRVSELDGATEDNANVVVLTIILPTTASDVESASRLISGFTSGSGGGSLSVGDVMAIAVAPRQLLGDVNGGSLGRSCTWVQSFVACSEDDPRAIFVDRLHGSRGETPTTVVQWSKGTVF